MTSQPPGKCIVCVNGLLAPIFDQFLDIQRRRLEELDQALAAADFTTLELLGHAIKGGAATYELPDAAALGAALEIAAVACDSTDAAQAIAALRRYFARLSVRFVD